MNKIAIIGCGNMGLIYANSFLRYKIVTKENLLLVEKNTDRQKNLSEMNIGKVVTTEDKAISEKVKRGYKKGWIARPCLSMP